MRLADIRNLLAGVQTPANVRQIVKQQPKTDRRKFAQEINRRLEKKEKRSHSSAREPTGEKKGAEKETREESRNKENGNSKLYSKKGKRDKESVAKRIKGQFLDKRV